MSGRIGFPLGHAALNAALSVAWCLTSSWAAFVVSSLATVIWLAVAVYQWRNSHGSNREAEAGSQDPDPGTFTVTWNTGGPISPSTGTFSASTPARPDLEVVESEVPILGQRAARLLFNGTSEHWGSLNGGIGPNADVTFGVNAKARCHRPHLTWGYTTSYSSGYREHAAPDVDCACGFYAVPCDIEPWAESGEYVTLLVELSGTVIEHEKGYRASHQRVMECRIPPCRFCGAVASVVDVRENVMASACCESHVPNGTDQVLVTVADLRSLLPVPVTAAGRPHGSEDQ